MCSNWEHVKLKEICKKFTEWNINVKTLKSKIFKLLHGNMIILDKNVSHGNSSNILWRDRTLCKLILDPYVWNKFKDKDDWLDNYVQNNNLCSCLFIIVSAESLIDPKKI